jgi:hypothetical protein
VRALDLCTGVEIQCRWEHRICVQVLRYNAGESTWFVYRCWDTMQVSARFLALSLSLWLVLWLLATSLYVHLRDSKHA